MKYILLLAAAAPCFAQIHNLRVFSELTRIDPFGEIVKQDRGTAPPRHILSPGVPRNAFSSFRIAVTFDKPAKYILDIGQNPENAVKATLYREKFEKHGDQWIPDGLEPVKIPYESSFLDNEAIPGRTTVTFWLDLWVDRNAPVDRIKVEPQLWLSSADDWYTYPMEVRILHTTIPNITATTAAPPPVTERSDSAVFGPLRSAICKVKEEPSQSASMNARALIRRNTLQHLRAQGSPLPQTLSKVLNLPSADSWCSAGPPAAGPEWYLRLRDLLLQSAELSR